MIGTLRLGLVLLGIVLLQVGVCFAASTALSIIDSPLRQNKPLRPDEIEQLVL
jgi:hypothetical protein